MERHFGFNLDLICPVAVYNTCTRLHTV